MITFTGGPRMFRSTIVCSPTSASTYFLHKKSGSFRFLLSYKLTNTNLCKCLVSMITELCTSFHSIYRDTNQTNNTELFWNSFLACSISRHQSKSWKGEMIPRDFSSGWHLAFFTKSGPDNLHVVTTCFG